MEYTEHYNNMIERNAFCDTAESNGFRMLYDNFCSDWRTGDEPRGTLTFTDMPAVQAPPIRDAFADIDAINAKIADYDELRVRVKALEKK